MKMLQQTRTSQAGRVGDLSVLIARNCLAVHVQVLSATRKENATQDDTGENTGML